MADSDAVDLKQLRIETEQALLEAIKEKAAQASTGQLDGLAFAFSLVVGAAPGKLPGLAPAPRG
jgi:hypothetical protein